MQTNRVVFRKGERVSLVILEECDVEVVTHGINDEAVARFLNVTAPITKDDEVEWIKKVYSDKEHNVVFGVWHNKDECLIGTMGIHNISWVDRIASTGAAIWDQKYRGQGLGCEAKELLLAYAFNTLNLRKVCSQVFAFNVASINYSKKCGYQVEATLKDHIYRDGKYWDQICMAIFQDSWKNKEK